MSLLSGRRRACATAVTLAAMLIPATSAAAATGNPQVASINPTTGAVTTLAGGTPWTTLGGIAIGPSGSLYVANQGPIGPNPKGAGIYSLAASGSTPALVASGNYPTGVAMSGSTLYSLDGSNVLSLDTATPGAAPQVVSSGGLYSQYGVQPEFGTVSGGTLYTTAYSGGAEAGGSYVIAVNLATGAQTMVKSFGSTPLGGIAATSSGALDIAVQGKNPRIVQLNPATGALTTLSSGGQLKTPQGIAIDPAGDIVVADSTSGVITVSSQGGDQSPVTNTGTVGGATGVAVGSDGTAYITEAGIPPKLKATAKGRQAFRTSGIRMAASCNRSCTVGYTATIRIAGKQSFIKSAAFRGVSARRTLRVKLPGQVNRRINSALSHNRKVTAKIAVTPRDATSGSAGTTTTLRVRLLP